MTGRPIADSDSRRPARPDPPGPSLASTLAGRIKGLVAAGEMDAARDQFGELVTVMQRPALRIAYHYLRDAADADEAVQDAFVKVYVHIEQYREGLSFNVWFTRILVNACLDRLKSRARQRRWLVEPSEDEEGRPVEQVPGYGPSSERQVLARERFEQLTRAVATLPERQKLVFTLSYLEEYTAAEISTATGMSTATVRVHLFRALRKLRGLLGDEP